VIAGADLFSVAGSAEPLDGERDHGSMRRKCARRLKPSSGLEPETPSLPCDPYGNRWQPVATVRPYFKPFSGLRWAEPLPPVAPPLFHNCSIPIGPKTPALAPGNDHGWRSTPPCREGHPTNGGSPQQTSCLPCAPKRLPRLTGCRSACLSDFRSSHLPAGCHWLRPLGYMTARCAGGTRSSPRR
jgi:hypothetical protein